MVNSETGRILVVDDDPTVAEVVARYLIRDGYDVAYADTVIAPFVTLIDGGIRGAVEHVDTEVAPGVRVVRVDRGRYGEPEVWRGGAWWCASTRGAAQRIAEECLDAGVTMRMLVSPQPHDWLARLDLDDPPTVDHGAHVN